MAKTPDWLSDLYAKTEHQNFQACHKNPAHYNF
jgi:hypothetical protein